jgi:hypothetical protein
MEPPAPAAPHSAARTSQLTQSDRSPNHTRFVPPGSLTHVGARSAAPSDRIEVPRPKCLAVFMDWRTSLSSLFLLRCFAGDLLLAAVLEWEDRSLRASLIWPHHGRVSTRVLDSHFAPAAVLHVRRGGSSTRCSPDQLFAFRSIWGRYGGPMAWRPEAETFVGSH